MDIRGWDVETSRSVASVTWTDSTTNVYRVGHKGKVDLKCIVEALGGFYYKEHLPKLGAWQVDFGPWASRKNLPVLTVSEDVALELSCFDREKLDA